MKLSRRDLLKGGLAAGLFLSAGQLLELTAMAADGLAAKRKNGKRILVIVQLNGGNDGLNMVAPIADPAYYKLRPSLAIPEEKALTLDAGFGLHPAMKELSSLYCDKKLAIVHGVGYPAPNRSHFRSVDIWQTAAPDKLEETGWLGRYLDGCSDRDELFPAVNLDSSMPKTLVGREIIVPTVPNLNDFRFKTESLSGIEREQVLSAFSDIYSSDKVKGPNARLLKQAGINAIKASDKLQGIASRYNSEVTYPPSAFGNSLKLIAQMITGGLPATIYGANLDGFDTHVNQARHQDNLLKDLSKTLNAFQTDLDQHKVADDVVVMVFSEFGRRAAENGGKGTDHGTAGPVLLLGNSIRGGTYGEAASLTKLDQGDLRYTTDFRSVYATLLSRWFGADSREVLGGRFENLRFV
ncbi:MAG: DUF1501 domain-containing protein [Candidatus Obscuribacterales bacterium]|nr:DUF1501 domain-containing protein [Candidatus Obscuribacterales bacterium]